MQQISNMTFDAERALYGSHSLAVVNCTFDGPADGESALKECTDIRAEHCYFNLRYPFWHVQDLVIRDCELTAGCRAALWYTQKAAIYGTKLHGIKALRECADVQIEGCDIVSPEFGWNSNRVQMTDTTAESEYFMFRAMAPDFRRVKFRGKYSFQYVEDGCFEDCDFDTKDAFWHAKNTTVRNSTLKGEYLAWYSENLTLENCTIIGTQPLCYCKGLRLINCRMIDTDLSFEKSEVQATVLNPMISIKNPAAGEIVVPAVDELIMDDPKAQGKVTVTG